MTTKDEKKAARERDIFGQFCGAAGIFINPRSVESRRPPEPDVRYEVSGHHHCAELVEITDEELAAQWSRSLRTGEITGGFFSQNEPLIKAFQSKQSNHYQTNGAPMLLLAYYQKQCPISYYDPSFVASVVELIARSMVETKVWHSVWVFDCTKGRVLWKYPGRISGPDSISAIWQQDDDYGRAKTRKLTLIFPDWAKAHGDLVPNADHSEYVCLIMPPAWEEHGIEQVWVTTHAKRSTIHLRMQGMNEPLMFKKTY